MGLRDTGHWLVRRGTTDPFGLNIFQTNTVSLCGDVWWDGATSYYVHEGNHDNVCITCVECLRLYPLEVLSKLDI